MANNRTGRKRPNIRVNPRRVGGFDKKDATLVHVQVSEPGITGFPSSYSGRCWVEWVPRLDATGADKRCFYSKVGEEEYDKILGESGNKLPRNGASLNPQGRKFMVLCPGVFKVWKEAQKKDVGPTTGPVESIPASVNSQAVRDNVMLTLVGNGYAETIASRAPSSLSTSREARHRPSK